MKQTSTLLFVLLAIFASASFAGFTQPQAVVIDTDAMTAMGDQWTARNDADNDVFIGCGVRRFDLGGGGTFAFGFCQAEDSAGANLTCFTEEPGLLSAIEGLADFSYIQFAWSDDGAGNLTCIHVGHSTQSFYLPELKSKK